MMNDVNGCNMSSVTDRRYCHMGRLIKRLEELNKEYSSVEESKQVWTLLKIGEFAEILMEYATECSTNDVNSYPKANEDIGDGSKDILGDDSIE